MTVRTQIDGLAALAEYFRRLPDVANQAAAFAINEAAGRSGLAVIRQEAYREINFPKGYLNKERLGQTMTATPQRLEARVTGRDRATSLASFAVAGQTPDSTRKTKRVSVQVRPGQTKTFTDAWLVNLKNGNIGLAFYLKPGQMIRSKTVDAAVKLGKNIYLLYGPSVDQVVGGAAWEKKYEIENIMTNEFLRQFARLSNG